tara:strand:+ start:830 stop:976 length:147 start_codon:yes stop_codon:yes gene_type:complete
MTLRLIIYPTLALLIGLTVFNSCKKEIESSPLGTRLERRSSTIEELLK